jgi:uncharacterized protein YuzE
MDRDRVSEKGSPVTVTIAGIEFDDNFYDRDVDVLYLHVGPPSKSADWDETAEGDGVSYGPDGAVKGLTILNAKLRLEEDGEIVLTFPEQRVVARDVHAVLA